MSHTLTQTYQIAQPRVQPVPNTYQIAQRPPVLELPRPQINPLLQAGLASAQANADLNKKIREDAKRDAQPAWDSLFSIMDRQRQQREQAKEDEKEEDEPPGFEEQPLIQVTRPPMGEPRPAELPPLPAVIERPPEQQNPDVQIIVDRQPPPPGVNQRDYGQFVQDILERGRAIGQYTDVVTKMLTTGTLLYHLWTESQIGKVPTVSGSNGDETSLSDSKKKIRPLEERINDPIPPQCYRHVYKDERGQLRSIVICKTEGHGQRFYHDA